MRSESDGLEMAEEMLSLTRMPPPPLASPVMDQVHHTESTESFTESTGIFLARAGVGD